MCMIHKCGRLIKTVITLLLNGLRGEVIWFAGGRFNIPMVGVETCNIRLSLTE